MSKMRKKQLFRFVRQGEISNLKTFIADSYTDNTWKSEKHEKCGDSLTHVASRYGQLALLQWLVEEQGIDPLVTNHDGKTTLHEAAHFSQSHCVGYLIEKGVPVDCLKRADWTPLMLACTKCSLDTIKVLMQAKAKLTLKNKDGWNSFHIACREGHPDIVDFLLKCDPSIWNVSSKNMRTPLHTAALHGCMDVTRVLLERGDYPPDTSDSCGTTPLMDALRGGHLDVADMLLTYHKAGIHREDVMGRNGFHLAAQAGCESSVKYLVQTLGVDVNIRSIINGITPIHLAAKEGHSTMISLLCAMGANPDCTDNRGRTALHQACGGQFTECVRVLISCGARDNPDNSGQLARDLGRKDDILRLLEDT